MAEHDRAVFHAQRPRGPYVFQIAATQELGAYHVHQAHPGKQQHDAQQPPEVGLYEAGEDDQQIQYRQARPDLEEALAQQVDPAAIEALQGTGDDADDRAEDGQGQGEQYRNPETVDHPCQHVTALVIGTQQVFPGGWRRCRDFQVVVDALVAERDGRPQGPAILRGEQFLDIRALVVGFQREFTAKGGFRVTLEYREVPAAVITHGQRFVVGDQFGAQAQAKQNQEQPQ